MNRVLDLRRLVDDNKSGERLKLKTFAGVLDNCFDQIERYSREYRATNTRFSVPFYINGVPPYNYQVLVNYLVYHLRDNGVLAYFDQRNNQIYISWAEGDIDLDKYDQRQQRLANTVDPHVQNLLPSTQPNHSSKYGTSALGRILPAGAPKPKPRKQHNPFQAPGEGNASGNVIMLEGEGPINREKYRIAKERQLHREHRFRRQVMHKPVPKVSYQDFMRSGGHF